MTAEAIAAALGLPTSHWYEIATGDVVKAATNNREAAAEVAQVGDVVVRHAGSLDGPVDGRWRRTRRGWEPVHVQEVLL